MNLLASPRQEDLNTLPGLSDLSREVAGGCSFTTHEVLPASVVRPKATLNKSTVSVPRR